MAQLALIPPHRNQQLFSDYYLDHLLPQRADWQALAAEAAPVMAQIRAIYDAYTPSNNEAQLEAELARPVLSLLGHTFEVQAALRTPDGTKRPDYVLYHDQAALQANKNKTLTDTLMQGSAIAVGDAKAWDVSLDAAVRSAKSAINVFTNKNPSFQLSFYMQHSDMAWGMLTNGRLWRLYHKDTAHKLDRFYEVDLPALLAEGQPARFLYFYALFRRAAFNAGPLSLDAMLQASRDYARGVGDSLKTQVYDALLHLAQGFLDHPNNDLQPDTATLKTIYDYSLIVLYRLLFILYAEARDLLPLRTNQLYREQYSLMAIKRRVAADLDGGTQLLPTSTRYWNDLSELFRSIDQGNPPLHVATFNGGLFDAARYPFLQTKRIGDARLQHAIDLLARVNGEFVDYRDLAERHLGTIYEGLLEYHLEPLPAAAPSAPFTIDLRNDKGERKATGSYYTPDYIVKYIVDQTVGPVLHAAVDGLSDDAAIINAVLDVNVLDPAMGSGHFLVEATERIARFLVDLGVKPDEDTLGEADVAYWRRRVVQSCIYGVDLNPLAVDLAKLSLWLATVAQDRPLSFLDHHLRTGNALIGARIADLQVGGGGAGAQRVKKKKAASSAQLSLLDDDAFRQSISSAVDSMWLIESSPSASAADVKAQEQAYAELRRTLTRRYGRLADLVTATYFGLQTDPTLWQPLADYATGRTLAAPAKFGEWIAQAEQIADARRFFHWELEFPKIFFDRHGYPLGERAGFDAVIGNPPYGSSLSFEKDFIKASFVTFGLDYDSYTFFMERTINLVKLHGLHCFIVPSMWLTLEYNEKLRRFILVSCSIKSLLDTGRVFEDVIVGTAILVLEKLKEINLAQQNLRNLTPISGVSSVRLVSNASTIAERLSRIINWDWDAVYNREQAEWWFKEFARFDYFVGTLQSHIITHLRQHSSMLGDLADVAQGLTAYDKYRGQSSEIIKTRAYHANSQKDETFKKFLQGSDVGRYELSWSGEWISYGPWLAAPRDPKYFTMPRLLFREVTGGVNRPLGVYTVDELYCGHSVIPAIVTNANLSGLAILAIVNSQLLAWYNLNTSPNARKGQFPKMNPSDVASLPIRRIAFTTPAAERERLADKGRRLYEQFCQKHDYACVLGFVEHHLGGGERPDDKSSGYANKGHLRGLEASAREGGLRVGSPPIYGPGTDATQPHTNATQPPAHPVEPPANTTQPPAATTQPHANTPADVSTMPAPHANATVQHANVTEPRADTLAPHADVTAPRAETVAPHANVTEPHVNAAAPQGIIAPAPDIVHDLLAFLAQQMIALHKQRQTAVEAFVLDLEGVLDAGAVDKLGRLWTPPAANADTSATADAQTVLGSLAQRRITLRDDIGALNEAQWKWLTKRRLKHVPNFAHVVQVFRDHQPALAALDQRIAATDRLIDGIVYRLYGLTDAEIALVEGGAGVVPGSEGDVGLGSDQAA